MKASLATILCLAAAAEVARGAASPRKGEFGLFVVTVAGEMRLPGEWGPDGMWLGPSTYGKDPHNRLKHYARQSSSWFQHRTSSLESPRNTLVYNYEDMGDPYEQGAYQLRVLKGDKKLKDDALEPLRFRLTSSLPLMTTMTNAVFGTGDLEAPEIGWEPFKNTKCLKFIGKEVEDATRFYACRNGGTTYDPVWWKVYYRGDYDVALSNEQKQSCTQIKLCQGTFWPGREPEVDDVRGAIAQDKLRMS